MQISPQMQKPASRSGVRRMLAGLAFVAVLLCGEGLVAADAPVASEAQVKAVFLYNFTKYVDWPTEAFARTNSPLLIGVLGDGTISEELKKVIVDKTVNGRKIMIQETGKEEDWPKCQIIFISSAEKARLPAILAKIKTLPILTVGEAGGFLDQGGIINFTKKDDRIRLEIGLEAARLAKVQISSQLLSVADTVKGKSN